MAGPGIVIQIRGDGEGARAALEMVQQKMRETEAAAARTSSSAGRLSSVSQQLGSSLQGHAVPGMAAASAGLRALEGNFTHNIRAGERFLTLLPGMEAALQAAFPVIGLVVLGTALFKVGEEAYHTFQNVVMLKGAFDSLGKIDLKLDSKLKQLDDDIAESRASIIESRYGKAAGERSRRDAAAAKGLDLRTVFDDDFAKMPTNVKANYEAMYKDIAPDKIPEKIAAARAEITQLNAALKTAQSNANNGVIGSIRQHGLLGIGVADTDTETPKVGGYGPSMLQNSIAYYQARLGTMQRITTLLEKSATDHGYKVEALDAKALKDQAKEDKVKAPKVPKVASEDPIDRARTALLEEQAKTRQQLIVSEAKAEMEKLQAGHQAMLIDDKTFYDKRLDLQNREFDAEQQSLDAKRKALQDQYDHQRDPKTKLKRDKSGVSAEETETLKLLEQEKQKQEQLNAARSEAATKHDLDIRLSKQNAELAGLRLAAELERERGTGISAQIALLERESALEQQRTRAAGGSASDVAAIQATAQLNIQRLRLNETEQQISRTESDFGLKVQDVNDRVSKGITGQIAGRKEIQEYIRQESAALVELIAKYQQQAAVSGNPEELARAKQYQQQLLELGRVDQSQAFGTQVRTGLEGITTSLANMAATGKQSFKSMVDSMVQDVARLAMEIATKKFLTPLFEGFGGTAAAAGGGGGGSFLGGDLDISGLTSALFEQHASGGLGSGGPQVVGEKGIELWTPPSSGGSYTTTDMLKSMAEKGGGGGTPQVTQNITNRSNTPLTSSTPKVSYNRQLRQFVIDTILDEHDRGGPVRDLFGH